MLIRYTQTWNNGHKYTKRYNTKIDEQKQALEMRLKEVISGDIWKRDVVEVEIEKVTPISPKNLLEELQ